MTIRFGRRRYSPYIRGGALALIVLVLLAVTILTNNTTSNMTTSVGSAVLSDIPIEKDASLEPFFCDTDKCEDILLGLINESKESIHCALFELNLKKVVLSLINKSNQGLSVRLVVDDNYYEPFKSLAFVRQDNSNQLMHNKFCIFDDKKVFTGSFNPTFNGAFKNNENMVVIKSDLLAQNYENEFDELWNGIFGDGKRTEKTQVYLGNILVKNYFCPEDWCANKILEELYNAKSSIYFMFFSFTHDKIGDMLVNKSKEGIIVSGVMEKSQNNQFSEYDKLKNAGIDVVWDEKNKEGIMHNKIIIIDNETVITGSFNPTSNADQNNDENIIIVKSKAFAERFLQEFERVR